MTAAETSPELELLLDYLKRTRGFDFTAYKRASLTRRILKRMQTLGIQKFADYTDYLELHPEEFPHLFNTILINVTGFFRDREAWEYVAAEIVPRMLADKAPDDRIRVWSAGCASGEEAYTLTILLAEHLGPEQFRRRVKIYATDVDEEALAHARLGVFAPRDVEELPAPHLARYFEAKSNQYVFHRELRRSVIFGRHDLVQNAPISRVDLLVCRNTLMYFNRETQLRVLGRFHYALNEGGFLFLGKAEMLLTHANLFVPVEGDRRVFRKVPQPDARARLLHAAAANPKEAGKMIDDPRLREAAFDIDPTAEIVLDATGVVVLINDRARGLFGLTPEDVGRPLRDLAISYRPTDLRVAIDEATADRRAITRRDLAWPAASGEARILDMHVVPLFGADRSLLGTKVTFIDVTLHKRLQKDLEESKQALERAYEDLQSSNEELETSNEELQSSNEELETMNEELQSTNEELETINTELRERTDELNDANSFLGSILSGLRAGVAVVDRDMKVLVWNERATDLWGLREEEAQGHNFLNLDIGLPVAHLRQPIRACLAGESRVQQLILDATNRRGRTIRCRITCTPLDTAGGGAHRGVILVMEPQDETAPA